METDFLIVGAGIVGLTVARELSKRYPDARITVLEKEREVACHASGRNSGVLHAGFYYHADSLKAKFTAEGNRILTEYCLDHGLAINRCGKVVVARDETELATLLELKRRGDANNVLLHVVDQKELHELEPNARTFDKALYSPATSTVDPKEICSHIAGQLKSKVNFLYGTPLISIEKDKVISRREDITFRHLVNCAGVYADTVAHKCGVGLHYAILPFKGLYIGYGEDSLLRMHVYPVPDLKYPFLGVHFTKTVKGHIKIGPTAVPALWRENYRGFENFRLDEFLSIYIRESMLFITNSCKFRELALKEIKKYFKRNIIARSASLVNHINTGAIGNYMAPGIRAQLFDKKNSELVSDFVIERGERSTHVLNAVSPAFTCSFLFAQYIVDIINGGELK